VEQEGLVANADRVGTRLMTRFEALRQKHAIIGDVRGEGLMIGVELVTDRQSKSPAPEEARRATDALREGGVVLGRSGHHRNVLRFSPPLCATEADADMVADVLDHALSAA
jgi:4-aminobutyrate aminotransferase-like enzyme